MEFTSDLVSGVVKGDFHRLKGYDWGPQAVLLDRDGLCESRRSGIGGARFEVGLMRGEEDSSADGAGVVDMFTCAGTCIATTHGPLQHVH